MTENLLTWSRTAQRRQFAYDGGLYMGPAVGHVATTMHPQTPYVGWVYQGAGAVDLHQAFASKTAARAWVATTYAALQASA